MKDGREITHYLSIGLRTKNGPYLKDADAERIHSRKSNDTKPTIESKTDTDPSEGQDTPVITCQESQIINQPASIMSTTTIANVSTILQGMTGLSQATTAPLQGRGHSGPPGGGAPIGQPTGGGSPAGPPGGGSRPPAGGPPGGTAPVLAAAAVPNILGIQNGVLKGAVPTTFDGDQAKTDQFI
jgi:hypothetical protein